MTFINRLKGYKLVFKDSAIKDLSKIDEKYGIAVRKKLEALVAGALGLDVKKLVDFHESQPIKRTRQGAELAVASTSLRGPL